MFHKVCDLTGFDGHLRFVDLLPGESSYNTPSFACGVGEVNRLLGFDPSFLSCCVYMFKQCCRSVLYFLFGFGGEMFVTFIVPSWNACLAVASWYVSFGDANDCRGELVVVMVYIRWVWFVKCREHFASVFGKVTPQRFSYVPAC